MAEDADKTEAIAADAAISWTGARRIDADSPWLGLLPFSQETQRFFFGRDAEIREIFLRVRNETLTVLFGQSGYGKTSLLNAGLIPKLRAAAFRPVLLRLRFEKEDSALTDQVRSALALACADETESVETLLSRWGAATLWECLHDPTLRPEQLALWPPVLIFDQFEEVFTLGATQRSRTEIEAFATEIADLVENRPPSSLQTRLEGNVKLTAELDYSPSPLRVIITLREDFLSSLESWKAAMPSLMRNRMALHLLRGPHAWEAVVRPGRLDGRNLVSDEVGAQIVRVIARRAPDTPLEEIEAVPPLLSLLCDELNRARNGAPQITAELVEQKHGDILHQFYSRCFEGFAPAVRNFVEDRLVTVGGHRNLVAREDAEAELNRAGVPTPAGVLDKLLSRRLLSVEERGGTQRIEITHDVLAPLVKESRDKRQERERLELVEAEKSAAEEQAERVSREKRRLRRFAIGAGIAAALALAGMVAGFIGMRLAQQAKHRAEQSRRDAAKNLNDTRVSKSGFLADLSRRRLDEGLIGPAVALSRLALPDDVPDWPKVPSAENALALAVQAYSSALTRPIVGFVGHQGTVRGARFSPDETRVLTWSYDGSARLWETETGRQIAVMEHDAGVRGAVYTSDRILTWSFDGTARLWDKDGRSIAILRHDDTLGGATFLRDKGRVLTWSYDGSARLWDSGNGKAIASMDQKWAVLGAQVIDQGKSVLTWSSTPTAYIWNTDSGKQIAALKHEKDIRGVLVLPTQNRIVSWSDDTTVRCWDAAGKELLRLSYEDKKEAGGNSFMVKTSEDETKLIIGKGKTLHLLNIQDGREEQAFENPDSVLGASLCKDNTELLTRCGDRTVRLWDVATGKELVSLKETTPITAAMWSRDKQKVITLSVEGTAQIWQPSKQGTWFGYPLAAGSVRSAWFWDDNTICALSAEGVASWFMVDNPRHPYASLHHRGEILDWTPAEKSNRILTASADGTATLWELFPSDLFIRPKYEGKFVGAKFSRDATTMLVWSDDNIARLFKTATGDQILALSQKDPVLGAEFSADDSKILTWCKSQLMLSAAGSGAQLGKLDLKSSPSQIKPSPDGGKIIVVFEDGTALIWHAKQQTAELHDSGIVLHASFSIDGSRVLTCSSDNKARLWNSNSGQVTGTFFQHELNGAALSTDGKRLLTYSRDGKATLWDAQMHKPLTTLIHGGSVLDAEFSLDSSRLLTHADEDAIRLWDGTSGKEIAVSPFGAPINTAHFSADGGRVVAASTNGLARLLNAKDGAEMLRFNNLNRDVALSEDGSRVFGVSIGVDSNLTASLWNAENGGLLAKVEGLSHHVLPSPNTNVCVTWSDGAAPVAIFSLSFPREQLLARASAIIARLRPLSPVDRATAHLDPSSRETLAKASEQELALNGDAVRRRKWKFQDKTVAPNSFDQPDPNLTVSMVTNERSETFIFHSRPWPHPVLRVEYNRLTRSLTFVLKGTLRDFGLPVDERLGKYVEKGDRVLLVQMDLKTGQPVGGNYCPLLVY